MKRMIAAVTVFTATLFIGMWAGAEAACGIPGKAEIVIGGTVSITGRFSPDGLLYKRGLEMRAQEINKAGGILGCPLKLIVYDDKSDPTVAVGLYERIVSVDKADFLFGPYTSGMVNAVAPVSAKFGVMLAGGGGCAAPVYQRGFNQLFTVMTAVDHYHSQNIVKWLAALPESKRPKTVAIVNSDNIWSKGCAAGAKEFVKAAGFKVAFEEMYQLSLADFTPLARKVKDANADVLLQCGLIGDSLLFAKTLKELNVTPKLFWNADGAAYAYWYREMGAAGEEIIGTAHWNAGVPYKGSAEFVKAHQAQFQEEPSQFVALGYATIQLYEHAIAGARSADSAAVNKFARGQVFDLVVGPVRFSDNGVPTISTLVDVMWRDGKRVIVAPERESVTGRELPRVEIAYPRPAWR